MSGEEALAFCHNSAMLARHHLMANPSIEALLLQQ